MRKGLDLRQFKGADLTGNGDRFKSVPIILITALISFFFLFSISSISSTSSVLAADSTPADLAIGGYMQTDKTRVGRTEFNYTFTAQITNNLDSDLKEVKAALTSKADNIIVIDGELDFGEVQHGQTVTSHDTFTIKVDRSYIFQEEDLSWSFTYKEVPTTPPSIVTFSPSPGAKINQSPINVSGTVDQDGVEVVVNGVQAEVTDRDFLAGNIPLTEGENTISIKAISLSEVEGIENFTVILDTRPPDLIITSPQEGSKVSGSQVSIIGNITDAHLISVLLINNVPVNFHENRFSHTVTLVKGENIITFYAKDDFGNETTRVKDEAGNEISGGFRIEYLPLQEDLTPPQLTISAPSEGAIFSSSPIQVIGRVQDESTIREIIINGAPVSASGAGFSYTLALTEGENMIFLKATDIYENSSSSSVKVFLDSTPPPKLQNVAITPSSPTNSDRVTLTGKSEAGVKIEATGGAKVFSTTALESGDFSLPVFLNENTENRLNVYAIDIAGHKSIEQEIAVVHDKEKPEVNVITPPAGAVLPARSVTVTVQVSDRLPISSLLLNGQEVSLTQDNQFSQAVELSEGANTITVEAKDQANNTTIVSIPVTVRITSDQEPPLITIISPENNSYHLQSSILIRASVIDASPIQSISMNGTLFDLGTALSGDIFTGSFTLSDNDQTLVTIEAVDSLGHRGEASISVFHDTIPPQKAKMENIPAVTSLSQLSIRGQAEAWARAFIRIGRQEPGTQQEAGIPQDVGTQQEPGTLQEAGACQELGTYVTQADEKGWFGQVIALSQNEVNIISITCMDRAGNESEAISFEIRQDSSAPQVSLISPSNGQTGVDPMTPISILFSESVDCASVAAHFSLLANGVLISHAFRCEETGASAGESLIFDDPGISELPPNTQFEVRIDPGLTDASGQEMGQLYRSFFFTRDTMAPEPPAVTSEIPEATRYRQITLSGKAEVEAGVIITVGTGGSSGSSVNGESSISCGSGITAGGSLNAGTGTSGGSSITGESSQKEVMTDSYGNFSAQITLQPNTTNTLSLVTKDKAGNLSEARQYFVRHDDLPPEITITISDGTSGTVAQSEGTVGVSSHAYIDLLFSEQIKISTLTTRISLYLDDTQEQKIPATLISDSSLRSARYIPENPLLPQKHYLVKIQAGISDQCGNSTLAEVVGSFSTKDTIQPEDPVITSYPAETKQAEVTITGKAEAGSKVIATGGASGASGTARVEATAGSDGAFSLQVSLAPDLVNHVTFQSQDAFGNISKGIQISITQDSTPPAVLKVLPDGSMEVRFDTNVIVTFSEKVLVPSENANSPLQANFFLIGPDSQNIPGIITMSQNGKVATFTPAQSLQQEKTYTILIKAGVSDTLGNISTSDFSSHFTTMKDTAFPREPVITSVNPPSPAKEMKIAISGTSDPYCQIKVTGGAQSSSSEADSSGNFSLLEVYLLENQINNLLITATNPVNKLSSSTTLSVIQDQSPPLITITAPAQGITLSKKLVTISGQVEDLTNVAKVLIKNGEKTMEAPLYNGVFVTALELNEGENSIGVFATDSLGQEGTASLHITYMIEAEGVDTTQPVISLTSPKDGATVLEERVYVEGTVEDNDPLIMSSLLINGKAPDIMVFNAFGAFVNLTAEVNTISVTAKDSAGNSAGRDVTVYSDPQEVPKPQLSSLPAFTDLLIISLEGSAGPGLKILVQGGQTEITGQADQTGAFVLEVVLQPNATNYLKVYAVAESGKKSQPAEAIIDQDSKEPHVLSLSPGNGASMVDPGTSIYATFSEPMDRGTITHETFLVSASEGDIAGTLSLTPQGTVATFTPNAPLPLGEYISVRLLASISDQHGFRMSSDVSFSFQVQDTPTNLSGLVVNPDLVPVEGVTIRIDNTDLTSKDDSTGLTTRTDKNGLFSLDNPPKGEHIFTVDGSTAQGTQKFTSLSFTLLIEPGKENSLGRPIFLTPVDTGSMTRVDPAQDQVLDFNGRIPGFSLEVAANSITLPDGKSNGFVTATEIDINNLPARLPDNSLPAMLVNLEPSGTRIDPSCTITFPNRTNLPVGSEVVIFGFEGGMQEYQVIGTGIVTEQGLDVPAEGGQSSLSRRFRGGDGDAAAFTASQSGISSDPGFSSGTGAAAAVIIRSKEPCIQGFSFYGYFPIEEQEGGVTSTSESFLAGRVVDVLGNGISGVKVDVAASDTRSTTDEEGYYKIPLPERAVFMLKVFAMIPTTLGDQSGMAQYAVFASETVEVENKTVTQVADIIVNCIFLGGDIRYVNSEGVRVQPGGETIFNDGDLISVSEGTAAGVKIMAFREEYPGTFAKEPSFTTQANQSPSNSFNHGRFSQQVFLSQGENGGALLLPGDLIRIVAFDEATGYLGFQDIRIPASLTSIELEADLQLDAPQVRAMIERVYYDDLAMERQTVPDQGIALVTDQFIYLNTCWGIQGETLPEIPGVKLYGRLIITAPDKEQDVRFDIPAGEYTRIIDLRDIYPQRKLALDIESEAGSEALTLSGSNNFDDDHLLYLEIGEENKSAENKIKEYKIHVFDLKLIEQDGEGNKTLAEGEIFPSGKVEIKDIATGQVYTIQADEKGQFKEDILLTGEQGFENTVYTSDGQPTTPFKLGVAAYPLLEALSITEGISGDRIVITGQNFSSVLNDNIVYLNGQRVEVIDADPNSLAVIVPDDASAGPVTVKVAGKTSDDNLYFDYISDGLPHGGFESGDLRGFATEGEAELVDLLGKVAPTEGGSMAFLSNAWNPLDGISTLSTDRFYVPEGQTTLSLDLFLMVTGRAGDCSGLVTASLQLPNEARSMTLFSPDTEFYPTGSLAGYETGTLFRTFSLDVSDLAGARIPVRLVLTLYGLRNIPYTPSGQLVFDDDSPCGGDKTAGSGLLVDHLRLHGMTASGMAASTLSIAEDQILVQSQAEGEGGIGHAVITGAPGAVSWNNANGMSGSETLNGVKVRALDIVKGKVYTADVSPDGGFSLEVETDPGVGSHFVLQGYHETIGFGEGTRI